MQGSDDSVLAHRLDHGAFAGNLVEMPVFEYVCEQCGRRFSALVGMTAEADDDACPHCGHNQARKLVSRFTRGRSEDERLDAMADRFEGIGEPESASEARALAREMGKALDDDLSDEMEEMLEEDLSGDGPPGDV